MNNLPPSAQKTGKTPNLVPSLPCLPQPYLLPRPVGTKSCGELSLPGCCSCISPRKGPPAAAAEDEIHGDPYPESPPQGSPLNPTRGLLSAISESTTGQSFFRQGFKERIKKKKSKTSISSKQFSRQTAASPKTFNPRSQADFLRCHPGVSQETFHRHVKRDRVSWRRALFEAAPSPSQVLRQGFAHFRSIRT